MIVNRLPVSFVLVLPLVFAACGGESLTLPPEGEAAHIEVLDGSGQQGRVGETLSKPLLVRVTDSRDRPVADADVNFTFTDGAAGGQATPASAKTDADGRASAVLKLGTRQGEVTGKAAVPVASGITPVEASFSAMSLAADANGISMVSGNEQTGTVNTALTLPLVVQVTDAFGNPVPNVPIEWSVVGGGSVSAASTITGADGQTSVTRTLGGTAGQQSTLATAATPATLVGSPITFTHVAMAGSATGVVKISGDNQTGSPGQLLSLPLVVQVLDQNSNPIANLDVTWLVGDGGGGVSPMNTITDAEGKTSTSWTLGPSAGRNTVTAVVSGVGTATFTAEATAGAPSGANSSVSASPTTITAGAGTSTITVTVRDAGNNPIAGASVSVASSGTGDVIDPPTATTGANGVATFTFSSTVGETKTITATAGGVTITDQATIVVQKAPSDTEIESDDPDPSLVGQPVRVVFTVTGTGGTPTGQVTVTADGGSETCTATVADGFCDITFALAGTNRRLTATYSGDARFATSLDRDNHRVDPLPPAATTTTITSDLPDPSDFGAEIMVSFTVTSVAGTPTGTVQVTDPVGGSCSASVETGNCLLTPGGTGLRTITATYQGGPGFSGSSDPEDHTVSPPPPVNTAPTAVDDAFSTPTNTPVAGSLTANDSPPEAGDVYTTVLSSSPTTPNNGQVSVGSDGSFTYTPAQEFSGPDTFEYTLNDGRGGSGTAIVTINVGP